MCARRGRRWVRRAMIALVVSLMLFGGLVAWMVGSRQHPGPHRGQVDDFGEGPAPQGADRVLRVMTWNIAWAHGTDPDYKSNRVPSRPVYQAHLLRMGQLIREQGADLVLLQEVDFDSHRSHGIDELAALARHSGLRYGARAVSWQARYIPYPYWPLDQQYGRMLSGGAVLSRYPIVQNRVVLHPKPANNPWWYNLFYLFRYQQQVLIQRGAEQLWVINNHLEAFDAVSRQQQAHATVALVQDLARAEKAPVVVVGGDLNSVPPEAQGKTGFPDAPTDDYRGDNTLEIVRGLPGLREVVPRDDYIVDEGRFFTFPTLAPTRRLDYLFANVEAKVLRYEVIRTGAFSDHLPVVAAIELAAR